MLKAKLCPIVIDADRRVSIHLNEVHVFFLSRYFTKSLLVREERVKVMVIFICIFHY